MAFKWWSKISLKPILPQWLISCKTINPSCRIANDGLIFSRNSSPYIAGANENFLKWKPAHLNSIDFLVVPNKKSKIILNKEFPNQIVDLYVNVYENNEPVMIFFDFMHVDEEQFLDLT